MLAVTAKTLLIALIAATLFAVVASIMVMVSGPSNDEMRLGEVVLSYYVSAVGVSLIVGLLSPFHRGALGRGVTLFLSASFVATSITITLHGLPTRWESKGWFVAFGLWAMLTAVGRAVVASERKQESERKV